MSNIDTIEIDTIDDKTSIGGKYWLAKVDCDVGISMQEAEHGQILSNLTCTLIESYFDNGVEINTIEDRYAFGDNLCSDMTYFVGALSMWEAELLKISR